MQMRKVALLVLLAAAEASHPAHLRRVEASDAVEADAQAEEQPPAPSGLSADGYPQLPAVSTMLDTASQTLRAINAQTDSLEKRMLEAQSQNQAKMARQKQIFEQKLKSQEEANRAVVAENSKISKEIDGLKKGNIALRQHAKEVRAGNKLMRDEMRQLQNKLGVARAFIATSLVKTDDSHAKELGIVDNTEVAVPQPAISLRSSAHRVAKKAVRDDDDEDDDDDDDDDDKDESFVELGSRKVRHAGGDEEEPQQPEVADALAAASAPQKPANPRDLLQVLSAGIESLSQEEKASEAKLRSLFLHQYQSGARHHSQLISQQKKLLGERAQLTAVLGKLRVAEAHLEDTRTHLQQRLRALGLFMQKLQHLALAPSGEAQRLMEGLPNTVTMPEEEKAKAAAALM